MDINLLPSRINDLKHICQKTNSPKFIGFLTSDELVIALNQIKPNDRYVLFGGYENAERLVLGVLPEWCLDPRFPIKAITFTYRNCDKPTHRDFLGALMAIGIARETIGDILVGDGKTVIFVLDDVFKFIMDQIHKVGNIGVLLTEGWVDPLPQNSKLQSFSVTVASTRIDCVVAAVCNTSRKKANEKILEGLVSINSVCVTKSTVNIKPFDKITVRKSGKFEITACDEFSKKGRIILKYNKYI